MKKVTFKVRAMIGLWDFDDYNITLRIEEDDLKEVLEELEGTCWPLNLGTPAGKAVNDRLKKIVWLQGYRCISSWKIVVEEVVTKGNVEKGA